MANTPDYSNFVAVSSIPQNGIGKQLNVVYGVLNKTTVALSYVNQVYKVLNTLKTLYQTYLDSDPEDYQNYSTTAGGLNLTLMLNETEYLLSASIGNVSVTIYSDLENNDYGAIVTLTETTVLKYTVGENKLKIALTILNISATQVEFVREDEIVVGYIYEYLQAGDKTLTATSAMLTVDENYTTVIGTKGDFIPTTDSRNCEVYENSSGELCGTEVKENVTSSGVTVSFDTLWYNLFDINGINYIKKIDEINGYNADTVYINNLAKSLEIMKIGGISLKALSRRFDIEFKTMYYFTYDEENLEYNSTSCEIPMLFVQVDNASTLVNDFSSKNDVTIQVNVSTNDKKAINYGYTTLLDAYDLIKDSVTFDNISDYCQA